MGPNEKSPDEANKRHKCYIARSNAICSLIFSAKLLQMKILCDVMSSGIA